MTDGQAAVVGVGDNTSLNVLYGFPFELTTIGCVIVRSDTTRDIKIRPNDEGESVQLSLEFLCVPL